jgi:AraC-like DNA-binding protein
MHLARRALTLAEPTASTVTSIANDHGFAELGRFAVECRKLFGESPSATLLRPHDAAEPRAGILLARCRFFCIAPRAVKAKLCA